MEKILNRHKIRTIRPQQFVIDNGIKVGDVLQMYDFCNRHYGKIRIENIDAQNIFRVNNDEYESFGCKSHLEFLNKYMLVYGPCPEKTLVHIIDFEMCEDAEGNKLKSDWVDGYLKYKRCN